VRTGAATMELAARSLPQPTTGPLAATEVDPDRLALGGSYLGNAGHPVSAAFLEPASGAVRRISAGRQHR
jgi:hypothetical protein